MRSKPYLVLWKTMFRMPIDIMYTILYNLCGGGENMIITMAIAEARNKFTKLPKERHNEVTVTVTKVFGLWDIDIESFTKLIIKLLLLLSLQSVCVKKVIEKIFPN